MVQKQKYVRRPEINYGSYKDFPKKCSICQANPKRMIRHGYYESTTGALFKKFKCKDCGHVMGREATQPTLDKNTQSMVTGPTMRRN